MAPSRNLKFCVILTYLICVTAYEKCQKYQNPVAYGNFPDPGVLFVEELDGYVAVTTSNYHQNESEGPAFPLQWSKDLIHWELVSYVFPRNNWAKWAKNDMWAPEIHKVNGTFHVYYSAKSEKSGFHAIGVAISRNCSNPFGPYDDFGKPIIEHNRQDGIIDVHWFRDPNTQIPYIFWKTNNWFFWASEIFMRRIDENGVSFSPSWPTFKLLSAKFWHEKHVVEGQWMIYRKPYYYLFFSANGFDSPFYHEGVARSRKIEGPYERYRKDILHIDAKKYYLRQNTTFLSPGHGSVVQTRNGQDWFVYHAWLYGKIGDRNPGRVLMLDQIHWSEDDWPYIGIPSTKPTPGPCMERKNVGLASD